MRSIAVLGGLVALSALAYVWPASAAGFDPFLASSSWLWTLIALAMFAIGWRLPGEELRKVARRWPVVLGGTTIQYATMPALAYTAARLARLEPDATIGLILVGCVPGAMASNVLTLLAKGNVSYSVSLTTLATLLSPLVVPWTIALAIGGLEVEYPAGETMKRLTLFVVLPVTAGQAVRRTRQNWGPYAGTLAELIANLVILWIIAVVVASNRERLLELEPRLFIALVFLNISGYFTGGFGGRALRLDAPMRRALALEVGMQNAGLGTTIALSLFASRPAVAIPCALYTFGCMLTGTALAAWWAGRPPS